MQRILKVRPVEGRMVHDLDAMEDGVLQFVGRAHKPFEVPEGKKSPYSKTVLVPQAKGAPPKRMDIPTNRTLIHGDAGTWEMSDDVITLPARREYVMAVQDGDLAPADADTARLCGVAFTS